MNPDRNGFGFDLSRARSVDPPGVAASPADRLGLQHELFVA